MTITVHNIMNLPSFKNATVLAGHAGLDNVVSQVSIADSPLSEIDYEISRPGDFYLSEFYFAKDSLIDMLSYLNPILASSGSGICILDEYIQELPPGVINYCNEKKFPVILNSVNIPYAVMIREIMELIIADGQNTLLTNELTSIIDRTVDRKTQLHIMKQINPHFNNHITAFYVTLNDSGEAIGNIRNFFDRDILSSGILYKKGVIGIVSHSEPAKADSRIQYYIEKLRSYSGINSIGISDTAMNLGDASKALNQAIIAADIASHESDTVLHYRELGVMKLFMLLSGQPELEDFYNDIIGTLLEYDTAHNSRLYETMLTYHKCHYQYKDTAATLFVHENTIRYRIAKAQELITAKAPQDDFRETFSLALKCKAVIDKYK